MKIPLSISYFLEEISSLKRSLITQVRGITRRFGKVWKNNPSELKKEVQWIHDFQGNFPNLSSKNGHGLFFIQACWLLTSQYICNGAKLSGLAQIASEVLMTRGLRKLGSKILSTLTESEEEKLSLVVIKAQSKGSAHLLRQCLFEVKLTELLMPGISLQTDDHALHVDLHCFLYSVCEWAICQLEGDLPRY